MRRFLRFKLMKKLIAKANYKSLKVKVYQIIIITLPVIASINF